MGQLFSGSGLTNQGIYDPSSGQVGFGQSTAPLNANADATLNAAVSNAANPGSAPMPEAPQTIHPSYQQAATMGAAPGGVNALSPALSKGGKLLTFLKSGVEGALAGRAASEQAVIESGGRRSGGAGMAFLAGMQYPQQQAQQLAQTQLAIGGAQPVQTPYGQMPAALASKILAPYLGYQGKIGAADIQRQGRENAAQTEAGGRVQAAQIQKRYLTVPNVGVFDTQQLDQQGRPSLIPGSGQGVAITPELAQDYGIPQDYIGKFMSLQNLSSLERNQIAAAPTVKTSTDALGITTTSTSQKQLPRGADTRPALLRPIGSGRGSAPAGGGGTGAGSALDRTAQQIVEGNMDPSQLPKRGASYTLILDKANQYSQQKYGVPFDVAKAQSDYDYAKNSTNQNVLKLINGVTEKGGALDIATKAAEKLPQFDTQTLNKVFNATATQFGSSDATNFHTAMLGLADEYSKIMGGGVSSDTGRGQALAILQAAYSKGQLSGAVDIMRQDIAARKQAIIGSNRYLMRQYGGGVNQGSRPPLSSFEK